MSSAPARAVVALLRPQFADLLAMYEVEVRMDIGVYPPASGTAIAAVETVLTVPAGLAAVLTQDDLGELAGAELLAHAGWPMKDVGMGDATTAQGLMEAIEGLVLANYRKNRHV